MYIVEKKVIEVQKNVEQAQAPKIYRSALQLFLKDISVGRSKWRNLAAYCHC
jgi:hypothetical protein